MATTNYVDHVIGGDHASRPAATTVPEGTTYSCTDHALEYQSDGATWSTRSTFGTTGGIAATLLDAKGDLIVASAADTAARLAAAANGASLRTNSAASTGLEWQLNKYDATAAPAVTDDSGDGYSIGSIWIDVTGDDAYICVDASVGAAVWLPFDAAGGGGADLSQLRLAGVKDDPADIALGAYGDEFEYGSRANLLAVWAKTNGASGTFADAEIIPGGSHFMWDNTAVSGRGLVKTGLSLPADFEVAALFSHTSTNMTGIGVHNGTVGVVACNYAGTSYLMHLDASYVYAGTGASGGAIPAAGQVWIALRRLSGNWRYRFSSDGTTWTTAVASSASPTVSSADRIWIGQAFSSRTQATCHRVVYGAPDLGLG